MMRDKIERSIRDGIKAKEELLASQADNIEKASRAIASAIKSGGKVLIFGNGGSAADSQHMAAELVGRYRKERAALPAIALTTNASTLTAIANDYGYDKVFSRQVEAIGRRGDVAVGISTSGKSKNVLEALARAGASGLTTIGIMGPASCPMAGACDIAITVSEKETPRIQECHIAIIHIICELVEDSVAG
jgi:D-sedoheptulose 7-phosphate isomerase